MTPVVFLASLLSFPSEGSISVSAYVDADELVVGEEYTFVVELDLPASMDASKAGAPAPFLQLDVPPSVRLVGEEVKGFRALSRNEFLHEPYERLITETPLAVPFDLIAEPAEGETIGINIVTYARAAEGEGAEGDGGKDYFFRERLELPVKPLAEGVKAKAPKSSWGTDEKALQIGDRATSFALPRADGTEYDLGSVLGKSNVIVTTYRAHW
ncbi:MAG: hypothetical protein AAF682_16295 [Planctomycetota bacterium]